MYHDLLCTCGCVSTQEFLHQLLEGKSTFRISRKSGKKVGRPRGKRDTLKRNPKGYGRSKKPVFERSGRPTKAQKEKHLKECAGCYYCKELRTRELEKGLEGLLDVGTERGRKSVDFELPLFF